MTAVLGVLWTVGSEPHTGRLSAIRDRLELRARGHSMSIPLRSIVRSSIDRGPAVRIRGLPVLRLELESGVVVRIASLEGTSALTDLSKTISESES
jgi:hypothetical protein